MLFDQKVNVLQCYNGCIIVLHAGHLIFDFVPSGYCSSIIQPVQFTVTNPLGFAGGIVCDCGNGWFGFCGLWGCLIGNGFSSLCCV